MKIKTPEEYYKDFSRRNKFKLHNGIYTTKEWMMKFAQAYSDYVLKQKSIQLQDQIGQAINPNQMEDMRYLKDQLF